MVRWLFIALILASATLVAWPAGRAAALINISGQWTLAMTHPDFQGTILCAGSINQSGTMLSSNMTCDFFGNGTLSGSINTTTGALTLSGTMSSSDQLNFSGTAAGDGNSMSGSWTVTGIPATGSFNGTRTFAGPGVGGIAELADVSTAESTAQTSSGRAVPVGLLLFGAAAACAALGALTFRRITRA